jgi:organic hydroperoxide reductase OsmC/OhrA
MAESVATVRWERGTQDFRDRRYSRRHRWSFDGGVEVTASSSPGVVRVPLSDPAGVDPEEAFVASLASCHLLSFLWLAAKAGFVVDSYADDAVGVLSPKEGGRMWVSVVTLRPRVRFSPGAAPDAAAFADLHHRAHEECFIANSVRTDVRCEPRME